MRFWTRARSAGACSNDVGRYGPDVRARLDAMGVSAVSVEQATPAALRAHLKSEIDTLGPLLVKAGVKAN